MEIIIIPMLIKLENGKEFSDKKQALLELAFSHFPLTISIDDKFFTFEWFSELEKFIKEY